MIRNDTLGAPLPEDPERAEREVSQRFLSGLWRKEELKLEDLKDWQYAGGDWRDGYESHIKFKEQFKLACKWPEHKEMCICDTDIFYNHYVTNRERNRVIVVGKCCIDKFLGPNRKRCEVCYEPHRNRKRNLCAECMKKYDTCIDCHEPLEWGDKYRDESLCTECKGDRSRHEMEIERYEYEVALWKAEKARLEAVKLKLQINRNRNIMPKSVYIECPKCHLHRRKPGFRLCYSCKFL